MKRYTITVHKELMDRVEGVGERFFIPSRSEFVRNAIKHYLRYLERKDPPAHAEGS